MGFSLVSGATVLPLTNKELLPNFDHPPLTIKQKVIERYGRDGGAITGDRRMASRKFKIDIAVRGNPQAVLGGDADYNANSTALFSVASQDELYLYDDGRGYRLKISVGAITPKSGAYRATEIWTLDCVAPDAAWETITEETTGDEYFDEYDEYGGAYLTDAETFELNNANPLEAYPVFYLTPISANSEFALVNITTGAVCRIGESLFTPGTRLVLDSRDGSAMLFVGDDDPVDVRQKIGDDTGFLILAPGVNVIRYESTFGAISMLAKFRLRRPF